MQNALPFAANLQLGGGFQQTYPAELGGAVEPGQSQTYVWLAPPTLGPGKQDFSTVAYTYRSTVDPTAHENAGLIGTVVIGRAVRSSLGASCISVNSESHQHCVLEHTFSYWSVHVHVLYPGNLSLACQDPCERGIMHVDHLGLEMLRISDKC